MSKIPSSFWRLPFILLLLLLILSPSQVNSQLLDTDQEILLDMKQQWGNPPSLRSWNNFSSSCGWPEIYCQDRNPRVITQILLSNKNLSGKIPPTICNLKNLNRIVLSQNNIAGNIPETLNNCLNLDFLDLSSNFLTGQIPRGLFLSNKLHGLLLHGNMLHGELQIPQEFGFSNNLIRLDLSRNSLSGSIPVAFFLSESLSFLHLGHNRFTGHIPTPNETVNLVEVDLSYNNLSGSVPENFGKLGLRIFYLSGNQLSGDIGEIISQVSRLDFLNLCSNNFFGKVSYDIVTEKFENSCLDDANMCSHNRTKGLSICFSQSNKSKSHLVIILFVAIGGLVITLPIFFLLARKKLIIWIKNKRNKSIVVDQWEMILFQGLNFSKWEILSNLTDNNLIGNGGSGKVYRFAISESNGNVAVK